MPYKASGKTVLIKRNNRWVPFKQHPSNVAAQRHARALNVNVTAKKHRRKRRR